jgi:hypothetical protein
MPPDKKTGYLASIKHYLDMRPGDDLKAFTAECKALSVEEKVWLGTECAKALCREQPDKWKAEHFDFTLT